MRLFVAVDPSEGVRAALTAALARIEPMAPRARWVAPTSYHVTLAFLGDIAEPDVPALGGAIESAARRGSPLRLRFAGAGAFGGRRARVLWTGIGGDVAALSALHRDLAGELAPFGYRPDHPDFSAHLTLARAAEKGGDPALSAAAEALSEADFGETRVDSVVLYRSELGPKGARYTPLRVIALG